MKTRSEAVEYLQARGLHAAERDWALGKTVVVATGPREHHGITFYDRAVYIIPKGDAWTVLELDRPRPEHEEELSLSEACARAETILSSARSHREERR